MVGFSHFMKKNLTCCSSTKQRLTWDHVDDGMEYMENEFSYNRFYRDAKYEPVQRFSNKKKKKTKNVDESHHSVTQKKTKVNQTNINPYNEKNDSVNSVDMFFGRFKKHPCNSQSKEKHMDDGEGNTYTRPSEFSMYYDFESETFSDIDWTWSLDDDKNDSRRSFINISASSLVEQNDVEAITKVKKYSELSTKTENKKEPNEMEVTNKAMTSIPNIDGQKLLKQDNHDNLDTSRLVENYINDFDKKRNGVGPHTDELINTYITTKSGENYNKKIIRDTQSITSELTSIASPSMLTRDELRVSYNEGIKHRVTHKDFETSCQFEDSTSNVTQYHDLDDDWNDILNRARTLEQRVFQFARNVPETITINTSKATDDGTTVTTSISTLASSKDSRSQSYSFCNNCDNHINTRNEAISAFCEQPMNYVIHSQELDNNHNNLSKRNERGQVDLNDSPSLSQDNKELHIIEIPEVEGNRFQNAIEYSLQFESFSSRSSSEEEEEEEENESYDENKTYDFDDASTSSSSSSTIHKPVDCSYRIEESTRDLNMVDQDNYNILDHLESADDEGLRWNKDSHLIEPETDQYVDYGNIFVESDEDSYYAVKSTRRRMETIREEDEEQDIYSRQNSRVSIVSDS